MIKNYLENPFCVQCGRRIQKWALHKKCNNCGGWVCPSHTEYFKPFICDKCLQKREEWTNHQASVNKIFDNMKTAELNYNKKSDFEKQIDNIFIEIFEK